MKKLSIKKIFISLFSIVSAFSFADSNVIRKISVTGNSEREIKPDIATISFEIVSKKESLSAANDDINKKIANFQNELKKKNIQINSFETIAVFNNKSKEDPSNIITDDFKGNRNSKSSNTKSNEVKKPSSYTATVLFLIKDNDFNKIAEIIGFSENDMLQSVRKNYDENSFEFSITEKDTTVDKAVNKVFAKFNNIKNKLNSKGINDSNIILGEYQLKENFDSPTQTKKDVYTVTHRFKVSTKNLKNLNNIISVADDNSINIYGNIKFDLSNKAQIESEMYSQAINQAKEKALSILASSGMTLSNPLIVSEDVSFQQKMIDRIDTDWEIEADYAAAPTATLKAVSSKRSFDISEESAALKESSRYSNPNVNYTPKPIKLSQNISVLYEIK